VAVVEALVSALFIVSGTLKLVDLPAFTAAVRRYELLHGNLGELAAKAVAIVEVGTGVLLVTRWNQVFWLCLGLALATSVSGAMLVKLIQGRRVPCGCFGGTDETLVGWWGVVRSLSIIALVVGVIAARLGGTTNQLMMSEWIVLVAAGGALWIGSAQLTIALKVFQSHTDA
jgi:hypothetical protein